MTKMFALLLSCGALLAARSAVLAPAQSYPGQPTQAKVWIQNHGKSEAVPVSLQEITADTPLRVQVTGTPTVQIGGDVELRRQTWQYSRLVVGPGQDAIVELNKAGAEGWETTGLQLSEPRGTAFVLKRPR